MKQFTSAISLLIFVVGSASADAPPTKPVAVPFKLLVTKHMVIKIKINGKGPYPVIFDTGSPFCLINTKTAKASGLIDKNAAKPLFSLFGPVEPVLAKSLEIGDLQAKSVPIIVMDHPTVELMSKVLEPVEGIIGFPFFARYRMSLDYQAKELTFVPNGYRPADILDMLEKLLAAVMLSEKPEPKILAPAALWGFEVAKDAKDEEPGVTVKKVLADSAAGRAGFKAGDRLLTLDDRWTDTVTDCFTAAGYVLPDQEVTVNITRGGKALTLTVKPQAGL